VLFCRPMTTPCARCRRPSSRRGFGMATFLGRPIPSCRDIRGPCRAGDGDPPLGRTRKSWRPSLPPRVSGDIRCAGRPGRAPSAHNERTSRRRDSPGTRRPRGTRERSGDWRRRMRSGRRPGPAQCRPVFASLWARIQGAVERGGIRWSDTSPRSEESGRS
jgi:hypothetical protein